MNKKTKHAVTTGILSAAAFVLMFFSVSLPFLPPFLKIDLSNVPIMICGFALGPAAGIAAAFIKAALQLLVSTTGGVGELADFLCAAALTGVSALFYKREKSFRNALIGCVLGMVAMIIMACIANRFLLIPAYSKFMPLEEIFNLCKAINPYIEGMKGYILFGVVPFNIIKGFVISLLTVLLYKKISKLIK